MHAKLIRPISARANRMKTSHWLSSTIFPSLLLSTTQGQWKNCLPTKSTLTSILFQHHPHLARLQPFFISRKGETVQFVSCDDMAYHAGVSSFQGREKCNAFSIGIELEGCDFEPFTEAQYTSLQALLTAISEHYPIQAVTGHQDIAPDRKTDPGHFFDWPRLQKAGFPIRRG